MANETVPTVEVDVQQQMTLAAPLAHGPYQEEEPPIDFGGAWDNFAVPLMRLDGKQQLEGLTTTRTTNRAGEW
jgi:hypothetical protein